MVMYAYNVIIHIPKKKNRKKTKQNNNNNNNCLKIDKSISHLVLREMKTKTGIVWERGSFKDNFFFRERIDDQMPGVRVCSWIEYALCLS